METYRFRSSELSETQPLSIEEARKLVAEGKVKATSMVYTETSKKWRLAASVQEIRDLIREFNSSQDEALNQIRLSDDCPGNTGEMLARRKAHEKAAKPFWKRILPS